MGYRDEVRENIILEGMKKSPVYAEQQLEKYQKVAAINYRLYKMADSQKEKQLRYADSQNAYAKAAAWKDVLAILLRKLSGR